MTIHVTIDREALEITLAHARHGIRDASAAAVALNLHEMQRELIARLEAAGVTVRLDPLAIPPVQDNARRFFPLELPALKPAPRGKPGPWYQKFNRRK